VTTLAYWPSVDTRERRDLLRELLHEAHDPANARPAILGDAPYDPVLWRRLTGDLGATAVLAPESIGGLGLGYEDFAAVTAELGRVLYSGPFFGSGVLALGALLSLTGKDATQLAGEVAQGTTVAALAFLDDRGRWTPATDAVRTDGDGRLTGRQHLVVDAPRAQVFVVYAGDAGLFAVDAADATVEPVESIDPTRALGTVVLAGAPATRLASGAAAVDAIEAAMTLGRLAVAAECVGGAEAALELSVDYAKSRRQFGRPIGSFQAVKHKCAEALIANEAAKAALSYAAWALDDSSPETDTALLAAKIAGVEAFVRAAEDCIQLHGTYGYTREASSQSYFRRARWLSLVLGSVDDDSQLLADKLGL
jgi:alkylation response protein AidB-like acyl-CoA dehydrogenase